MMKNNHTKFKQTEIGSIPEDWEVVRLGDEDVADIIMGQSPPSRTYNKEGIGLPFFQGKAEFGENYPTPIKWCLEPIKIAKEKDILVSVRAPVGDVNMAPFECCIGRGLAAIRPKDNLDHFYLLCYMKISKGRLEDEGGGTTFKAVGKSVLQNLKIPLPPLPEQQKIARILSTIQRAIEHQDKIITATRKLKKSLMHKLFTEGLNGEEQKETEIGRVPKSWDVMRLGDVVDFTKKPRTLNLSEFKEIPFIPMETIPIEKLRINDYLLKSSDEITSGVYCEKGDILLAKITPSFENGKQGIVENIPYDFAFATTEVYPLKPRNILLDKLFLFYFLIKSDVREAIAGKMQGTTGRKRVPKEAVENTLIPLPPLPEQQQIAHILSTVDKKIEIEERRKTPLKELFKTMLHKLMSGEIRLNKEEI